jgi:hypothetical protein
MEAFFPFPLCLQEKFFWETSPSEYLAPHRRKIFAFDRRLEVDRIVAPVAKRLVFGSAAAAKGDLLPTAQSENFTTAI